MPALTPKPGPDGRRRKTRGHARSRLLGESGSRSAYRPRALSDRPGDRNRGCSHEGECFAGSILVTGEINEDAPSSGPANRAHDAYPGASPPTRDRPRSPPPPPPHPPPPTPPPPPPPRPPPPPPPKPNPGKTIGGVAVARHQARSPSQVPPNTGSSPFRAIAPDLRGVHRRAARAMGSPRRTRMTRLALSGRRWSPISTGRGGGRSRLLAHHVLPWY